MLVDIGNIVRKYLDSFEGFLFSMIYEQDLSRENACL